MEDPEGIWMDLGSGKITAVIFDWAGTMVDFGCLAPTRAFIAAFAEFDLEVGRDQVRKFMGISKRDHIGKVLQEPGPSAAWRSRYKREASDHDIGEIYRAFLGRLQEKVVSRSSPIEGVVDVVGKLRGRGIKIGSTTGYPREVMERLASLSSSRGYRPDCMVCSDDLVEGRPGPLMIYQNMVELGVWPPSSVVKVDDTGPGIEEGLNAGAWTVVVALTGNEISLDQGEFLGLGEVEKLELITAAIENASRMGAHYVVNSVSDLPGGVEDIEKKLGRGEIP